MLSLWWFKKIILMFLVPLGQYICFTWILFLWLASFHLTFNSTLLMSYFSTGRFENYDITTHEISSYLRVCWRFLKVQWWMCRSEIHVRCEVKAWLWILKTSCLWHLEPLMDWTKLLREEIRRRYGYRNSLKQHWSYNLHTQQNASLSSLFRWQFVDQPHTVRSCYERDTHV